MWKPSVESAGGRRRLEARAHRRDPVHERRGVVAAVGARPGLRRALALDPRVPRHHRIRRQPVRGLSGPRARRPATRWTSAVRRRSTSSSADGPGSSATATKSRSARERCSTCRRKSSAKRALSRAHRRLHGRRRPGRVPSVGHLPRRTSLRLRGGLKVWREFPQGGLPERDRQRVGPLPPRRRLAHHPRRVELGH